MSTILDALKKSEAQRGVNQRADGAANSPPAVRSVGRGAWLLLVAAIGISVGFAVSHWLSGGPESLSPDTPGLAPVEQRATAAPPAAGAGATKAIAPNEEPPAAEVLAGTPEPENIPASVSRVPEVGDPSGEKPALPVGDTPATARSPGQPVSSPQVSPKERLPNFNQLPHIQQQAGNLALSMLVFASAPQQRFALINGQRLGNGDSLANGVTLIEIRRQGCVLEYAGQRFLLTAEP